MKFVLGLAALSSFAGVALLGQLAHSDAAAKAPELIGTSWAGVGSVAKPTLASRKGKVTLVHFWTFACSNCKANLPAYNRLYAKYGQQDVEFIGIHTPELDFERVEANVKDAIRKNGIRYPVLIDPEFKNWRAWKQEYWPTVYVVGKSGKVTFKWVGELGYKGADGEAKLDQAIWTAMRSGE